MLLLLCLRLLLLLLLDLLLDLLLGGLSLHQLLKSLLLLELLWIEIPVVRCTLLPLLLLHVQLTGDDLLSEQSLLLWIQLAS